ncbi:MAG: ribosomal protein S18-alanine N-acetyltransferase [Microcystaceae cyanobacterium]
MPKLDKKWCLKTIEEKHLAPLVQLDQICLGGLWTKEGYQRELDSPHSELLGLFDDQETLIGFGCFWEILEEAHITILMVHPDYQGQGIGQFLLSSLLNAAIKRQLERATLEVRASNNVALSLYKKFGFKVAGTRKGYYKKTGEDALILWRTIVPQTIKN